MNLFFRLLRILLSAYFAKTKTHILDVHTVHTGVWIGDHDPMGHMTNSRYASFTDLGIMNFMGRTGTLKVFRSHG
ncbi:MAG: thioesterase family protein, partial [Hyphomonas sp.]|nr:thioesterase family protein [Hyphomonas sp.]